MVAESSCLHRASITIKLFTIQLTHNIWSDQLTSGPYINISKPISEPKEIPVCALNFRKDLRGDLEYLAVSLVLTLTSADYDSCPKVNLCYGVF